MQAYSMDLRERALLDSDAGMQAADVAVVVGAAVEAAPAGDGRRRAARPAARGHRDRRQSRRAQSRGRPRRDRARRRHALVSAALQSGPQSHCALLREAQSPRACRPLSIHRDPRAFPRRLSAALQPEECRNYFRHGGYPGTTRS